MRQLSGSISSRVAPRWLALPAVAGLLIALAMATSLASAGITSPANDNFADVIAVTDGNLPYTNDLDTSAATTETGEPVPSCDSDSTITNSVWYSFTPAAATAVNIASEATGGTYHFQILGVYTGTSLATLSEVMCEESVVFFSNPYIDFTAQGGVTYYIQLATALQGASSTFGGPTQLTIVESNPPANNDLSDAEAIADGALPFTASVDTTEAGRESGETGPSCAVNSGNSAINSVWYVFTPSAAGPFKFTASTDEYSVAVGVYTGTGIGSLTQVACGSTLGDSPPTSVAAVFEASAGETYYIQVIDEYGIANSSDGGVTTVGLDVASPPDNDDFPGTEITTTVFNDTIDTTSAFPDGPLPSCGSGENNNSVWYNFTPEDAGNFDINTLGSDHDTILAVYTGPDVDNLVEFDCNDDADDSENNESQLFVSLDAGVTYYIQASSYHPGGGSLVFSLFASNDDFPGVAITSLFESSQDSTVATADGPAPSCGSSSNENSVWFNYTPDGDEGVYTHTLGSDYDTIVAVYTGADVNNLTEIACNDDGLDQSDNESQLSFPASGGLTYYIQVSDYSSGGGSLSFSFEAGEAPENDDFPGLDIIALPFTDTLDTIFATPEEDEPVSLCHGVSAAHSVWYTYTVDSDQVLRASTGASDYDTALALYSGGPEFTDLTIMQCVNAGGDGGEEVDFAAVDGTTYYFQLTEYDEAGAGGELQFSLTLAPGETFTVNSTADDTDAGGCEPFDSSLGTDCTLREALSDANAFVDPFNLPRLIDFDIGTGAQTISAGSALPGITVPVLVDGTTQDGYSGAPLIVLDGTSAGAGADGLVFATGSNGSSVKGLAIANFSGAGVVVSSTEVEITGNSINGNGGLGIDLDDDGLTPNDAGDTDSGANDLQNFPQVRSAKQAAKALTLNVRLDSTPGSDFRIEFFASDSCTSSSRQGATLIGTDQITTNGSGRVDFSFISTDPAAQLSPGEFITATATDDSGNTSEFSACRAVQAETATCYGKPIDIRGTGLDDEITGTSASDVISGFNGEDSIDGVGGDDWICGGRHIDDIDGGSGEDRARGGGGNDIVRGGPDDDGLQGNAGDDDLYGDGGTDRLSGQEDSDDLDGGPGVNDVCHGGKGAGTDTATADCEHKPFVP